MENMINETIQKAIKIRDSLSNNFDCEENRIDLNLDPIPPYIGTGKIKLIVIGQDPTIRNIKSRKNIKSTLNLDKNGSLKTYIEYIVASLNIQMENVYATNIFKYFYKKPPADKLYILERHLEKNLELIKAEISNFPSTIIITLGEPVLKLLCKNKNLAKVRYYWDYNTRTKRTSEHFKSCRAVENYLERDLFPFPHQPSMRKRFYQDTLKDYLSFVRYEFQG